MLSTLTVPIYLLLIMWTTQSLWISNYIFSLGCYSYRFGSVREWLVCELVIFYVNFFVLTVLLVNSYL